MENERLTEIVAARSGRVDHARGILYGVRIIGHRSKNNRVYTNDCLVEAVPLYEGASVMIDHPEGNLRKSRSYKDQIGILRKVKAGADGLRANFHVNLKHALAEQLLFDAEHAPDAVGLSHNVTVQTSRGRDGETIVERITRVESVDLVVNPATVSGLFESVDPNGWKQTLAEAVATEIGLPLSCTTNLISLKYFDTPEEVRDRIVRLKKTLVESGHLPGEPAKLCAADRLAGQVDPEFSAALFGPGTIAEQNRFSEAMGLPVASRNGHDFLHSIT